MTKLTSTQIEHIAKLAKMDVSKKETGKFQDQLSKVLDYIDELNEVDTENTLPTSQTTGLVNIKRSDEIDINNCLSQDEALSGTESTHNNYFKVPAVFEEIK
jgi:aspartyl-tRNA(Asn)/glutamyl-tRNA(Gln) amidotransferase subunit C